MLDGKYSVSLSTPMGPINGIIILASQGNGVQGTLETMGTKNSFKGMKTKENECEFSGNFSTPLGNIQYSAVCIVNGNSLELMAKSNKGSFKLQGKRM